MHSTDTPHMQAGSSYLETPNAEDRKLKTERNRDTTLRKQGLRPAGRAQSRQSLFVTRCWTRVYSQNIDIHNAQHVKVGIWSFRIGCRIPFNGPLFNIPSQAKYCRAGKKEPAEGDICRYETRRLLCQPSATANPPLRVQMSLAHSMKLPSQR